MGKQERSFFILFSGLFASSKKNTKKNDGKINDVRGVECSLSCAADSGIICIGNGTVSLRLEVNRFTREICHEPLRALHPGCLATKKETQIGASNKIQL